MTAVKRCQFYLVPNTNEVSVRRQLSEFANPPKNLETLGGQIFEALGCAIQLEFCKVLLVFFSQSKIITKVLNIFLSSPNYFFTFFAGLYVFTVLLSSNCLDSWQISGCIVFFNSIVPVGPCDGVIIIFFFLHAFSKSSLFLSRCLPEIFTGWRNNSPCDRKHSKFGSRLVC